jgi:hypothetical protein
MSEMEIFEKGQSMLKLTAPPKQMKNGHLECTSRLRDSHEILLETSQYLNPATKYVMQNKALSSEM